MNTFPDVTEINGKFINDLTDYHVTYPQSRARSLVDIISRTIEGHKNDKRLQDLGISAITALKLYIGFARNSRNRQSVLTQKARKAAGNKCRSYLRYLDKRYKKA